MAEKRKLQSEIEKTLKRVDDGIEGFDALLLKAEEAQTAAQKEKLEGELKRDIKKLQRLRDQIKVWLVTPEIKDKPPLEEARRKIEKEMEKFKVCEKLFKIKAFSKEGLAQERKLGPQEAEREKHRKWICDSLERLSTEIDSHEAEIERYKTLSKKGRIKGTDVESIGQLEQWVRRHKWHVAQLEKVLRKLANDEIEPMSQLEDLNESVDNYLESYRDMEFYHDDEMYAQYGLEDGPDFVLNRETDSLDGGGDEISVEGHAVANVVSSPPESMSTSGPSLGVSKKTSSTGLVQLPPITKLSRQESIGEADGASGGGPQQTIQGSTQLSAPQPGVAVPGRPSWSPGISYADAIKSTLPPPVLPQAELSSSENPYPLQQTQQPSNQPQQQHVQAPRQVENVWKTDFIEKMQQQQQQQQQQHKQQQQQLQQLKQDQPEKPQGSHGLQQPEHLAPTEPSGISSRSSVEWQADKDSENALHLRLLLDIVDVAYQNLPDLKHRRHFRYYQPKTAWQYPSFPRFPLKDFDTPQFFSKLDLDTLFFTFYHQQGTYQQYLAARELNHQNWFYHKKYQTWLQPHGSQKIVTDKFHRGTWVYFDYESGWCSRLKQDFTFEYIYLEEDAPHLRPHGP